MADDVIITGLNGVPAWATEDTLDKIYDVLKKTLGIQKAAAAGGAAGSAKSVNDELDELAELLKEYNKKLKEGEQLSAQDLEYKRRAARLYDKLGSGQAMLATTLALSVKVFDAMRASMINNVRTFDKMNESGILAAGTIGGQDDIFKNLGNMAMLASLRIEKLADILSRHSAANAVGAVRFAKSLGVAQTGLTNLGFNSTAAAEAMAAYLDTVAGTRDVQNMSNEEIAAGTERYAKNLTRVSLALGISREKLMQQTAAINASIEANALAAEYGDDAAQKMSMYAASFKDPAIGDAFVKMMSSKIPILNNTFQTFAKSGLGGLGMQISNFSKSLIGLDPEEAQRRTRDFVLGLGDLDPIINRQKFLAEAGVEGAEESIKMLIGMRQQQVQFKEVSAEEFQQQQRAAAATAKIATQWESMKASLQKIFSPSLTILTLLGSGLEYLAGITKSVADGLAEFDKTVEYIAGSYGVVFKDATATVITLIAALGGLVGAVKTLKFFFQIMQRAGAARGAAAAGGGIASTAAGGLGGLGGGGKAGSGLGGMLGGLGRGIGELLKGLGAGGSKLIEGILTGISKGVAAFASGKFVGGAAALSAGIAVLSLGLGAASWIMGKTLPTLSEGLRTFSDIDGSNLVEVGKGIIGLSAGLAMFGAGSVIAGAGTIMSGVMEKLGGLFGVSSPMDKITAFAAIGPDLALAGSGMSALAAGLHSFAGVNTNALSSNVDAVNKLKGPGGLMSWFKTPESTGIGRGGDTEPAQTALQKVPTVQKATGSGIEQPASDSGINTLLAQQVSLTSMLLAKIDSSLAVSKDILRYTKLQT